MAPTEANFDGLVGPTHNYAGLSWGNVASSSNQGAPSNPRAAALQGLAKMKYLADLGLPQGVLPPQERPHVEALRALGFEGSDREVVARAAERAPLLLALTSSASSMWAANAATVAPSADTADGRVHFTPANLSATFHRSLEPDATARALRRIFSDGDTFVVHDPVPGGGHLGDEGAANHTRLHAPGAPDRGAHLFVYGRTAFGGSERRPVRYPARQAFEASQAVARLHQLHPERTFFVQQRPDVIDEGVFHNDVIAVGNGPVLFHHEEAFAGDGDPLAPLDRALGGGLVRVTVTKAEARVEEVVRSYLFNSQLVTLPDGSMALVAPIESRESDATRRVVERVVRDESNPIAAAHFLDVRESMKNGGGPACLRLRVPLEDRERAAVHEGCWLDDALFARLSEWVERHYRDRLSAADLADPQLLDETREALDQLTKILNIGSIYPFQLV